MRAYISGTGGARLTSVSMKPALLIAIMTAIVLAQPLLPDRHRTTRRNLHRSATTIANTAVADTITPSSGMLVLSGYDKPLRSSRESIFATNRSRRTISSVTLQIEYIDAKGRQLHSRDVTLAVRIPPGETRQLTFASWDKQHAFFYNLSGKPRTSAGSPYSIRATPTRIVLEK